MGKENEKKPIYKRWWFIAIAVIFIIGLIGSMLEGDDDKPEETSALPAENETDKDKDDEEETDAVETVAEKDEEDMTVEEYAKSVIIDKIGEEAETGVPSIESIEMNNNVLTMALNETVTLTVNMARDVMLLNTLETAQAIVEEYGYEGGLSFIWSIPLVDNLGNEEYDRVLQLDFDPETLAKMNFGNIAAVDLGKAADMYFEHPAIKP